MSLSLFLFAFLISFINCAEFSELASTSNPSFPCVTSSDPCVVGPCTCAIFNIYKVATDRLTNYTTIMMNVTNICPNSVYYVDFNLNDGTGKNLILRSPSLGSTVQTNWMWRVAQVAVTAAVPGQPTSYLRFSPSSTQFPANNPPQNNKMINGASDIFTFVVSNYNPIYPWYYNMHYGSYYDNYGPIDASLCICPDCDANFVLRYIERCNITASYPIWGKSSRSNTKFNEAECLLAFAISGNLLSMYYVDEWPMAMGIQTVTFANGTKVSGAVEPEPRTAPQCVANPRMGLGTLFDAKDPLSGVDTSGTSNGCDPSVSPKLSCPRPLGPVLYYSDVTSNPSQRYPTGDWQMGGTAVLPDKVCGMYFYFNKTLLSNSPNADGTWSFTNTGGYCSTCGVPPPTSNYNPAYGTFNYGAGSNPIPTNAQYVGAVPQPWDQTSSKTVFGTQVAWDLTQLNLPFGSKIRFQFMVHDGDQRGNTGGDVGQACIITRTECPEGFKTVNDSCKCCVCDDVPLPGDGSWTFFCFPSGLLPPQPGYLLQKIPTLKLAMEPYKSVVADRSGFVPSANRSDLLGYQVGCDCNRTYILCPLNCCGNGACNFKTGVCTCTVPPQGIANATTCCPNPPTPAPTLSCPNKCCGAGTCNGNTGVCSCTAQFGVGLDCCPLPPPPTNAPTPPPTPAPTRLPTPAPTLAPTLAPTNAPTPFPTSPPVPFPTFQPTESPTEPPTFAPTPSPTLNPTEEPTSEPTVAPTPAPTDAPTEPPCFNGGNFCNGNGICEGTPVPMCVCTPGFFGLDCGNSTGAPTPPPTDVPCFNEGKFCSSNGVCLNDTCECVPGFIGLACDEPNNTKTCEVLNGELTNITCADCLFYGKAYGLNCIWCSTANSSNISGAADLASGRCSDSQICQEVILYSCPVLAPFLPPECPDNCSSNGFCVNTTDCPEIDALHEQDPAKYPYSCGTNYNESMRRSQNSTCACVPGFSGINCGDTRLAIGALVAIGAGVVAAIVVAALIAAGVIAGGGVAAMTSAMGANTEAGLFNNPLYQGDEKGGDNPLHGGH